MKVKRQQREDPEATECEFKGVCYTGLTLIGVVIVLIVAAIYLLL